MFPAPQLSSGQLTRPQRDSDPLCPPTLCSCRPGGKLERAMHDSSGENFQNKTPDDNHVSVTAMMGKLQISVH